MKLIVTYSLALLALVFSLSGCGKTYQVDSDFVPIVEEFNNQAGDKKADNLIVEYGEVSSKSAGATCYLESRKTPRIAVDRWTWDQVDSATRREIIRHEIGHCVLNRKHTTDRMPDNCPVSIMSPSQVGDWCRNAHGEEYDTELFSKGD